MLGLGVPEVFLHSGKQTLAVAPSALGFTVLYRDILPGLTPGAESFYGVDVWTADDHGEVFCGGVSPPLKPSEQTGNAAATYCIQWKRDESRVCALACSNVYLLETESVRRAASVAVPAKLRSLGGLFIPGTCAVGATDQHLFFCHEDGLILQYTWDMTFLGVVSLAATATRLSPWPPQRLSFSVQSDHLPVHHDRDDTPHSDVPPTDTKPVCVDWGNSSEMIGCAICSDGSVCFLRTGAAAAADHSEECRVTDRFLLEEGEKGPRARRRVLQTRFVRSPQECDTDLATRSPGDEAAADAGRRNIFVACLATQSDPEASCRLDLIILQVSLGSITNGSYDNCEWDPFDSAVVSVVSWTMLCANCPTQHCLDRCWSSLQYPYAVTDQMTPNATSGNRMELLMSRLQSCKVSSPRTDEIFVVLGARVFCVKLEFCPRDEKLQSRQVHAVARIKFSYDSTAYITAATKQGVAEAASSVSWINSNLLACYFAPRGQLVLLPGGCQAADGKGWPLGRSSKHHHFPIVAIVPPVLSEKVMDSVVNSAVFCRSSKSLYLPMRQSMGTRSCRTSLAPKKAPTTSTSKGDFMSGAKIDVGRCFHRVPLPRGLFGSKTGEQRCGWVVALQPTLEHTAIFVNRFSDITSGIVADKYLGAKFWLLRNHAKRWKVFDLHSTCIRFIDGRSIKSTTHLSESKPHEPLTVQACQWFGVHSCLIVALRGKGLTLEAVSTQGALRPAESSSSPSSQVAGPGGHNKTHQPIAHTVFRISEATVGELRYAPITHVNVCYCDYGSSGSGLNQVSCVCLVGNQFRIIAFAVTAHLKPVERRAQSTTAFHRAVHHYSISAPLWSFDLVGCMPCDPPRATSTKESYLRHPVRQVLAIPAVDAHPEIALLDSAGQVFRVSVSGNGHVSPIRILHSWIDRDNETNWPCVRAMVPMYNHGDEDVQLLSQVGSQGLTFSVILLCQDSDILSTRSLNGIGADVLVRGLGSARLLVWLPVGLEPVVVGDSFSVDECDPRMSSNAAYSVMYFAGVCPTVDGTPHSLQLVRPSFFSDYNDSGESMVDTTVNPVLYSHNHEFKGMLDHARDYPGLSLVSTMLRSEFVSLPMLLSLWLLNSQGHDLITHRVSPALAQQNGAPNLFALDILLHELWRRPMALCAFVHALELHIVGLVTSPKFNNPLVHTDNIHSLREPGAVYGQTIALLAMLNEYVTMEVVTRVSRKLELAQGSKMFPLPTLPGSTPGCTISWRHAVTLRAAVEESSVITDTKSDGKAENTVLTSVDPTTQLTSFLGLTADVAEVDLTEAPTVRKSSLNDDKANLIGSGRTEFQLFKACLEAGHLNHAARMLPLAIASVVEVQARHRAGAESNSADLSKCSHVMALDLLHQCWHHMYLNRLVHELLEFAGRVEFSMSSDTLSVSEANPADVIAGDESLIQRVLHSMWALFADDETASVDLTLDNIDLYEDSETRRKEELVSKVDRTPLGENLAAEICSDVWAFDRAHPWNCCVLERRFSPYGVLDILSSKLLELLSAMKFMSAAFLMRHALCSRVFADKLDHHIRSLLLRLSITPGQNESQTSCPARDRSLVFSTRSTTLLTHMLNVFGVFGNDTSIDMLKEFVKLLNSELHRSALESYKLILDRICCPIPMPLLLSLHAAERDEGVVKTNGYHHPMHNMSCPPKYGETSSSDLRGWNVHIFSPLFFCRMVAIASVLTSENFDLCFFCAAVDGSLGANIMMALKSLGQEKGCDRKHSAPHVDVIVKYLLNKL